MKQIFTLSLSVLFFFQNGNTQVVLNELYTDPGAGKHEFFELYNTNTVTTPGSTDSLTIVTFFDISGQKGFYVMDLPNMSIPSRSFFVGAAALPFNYQGITGSTAANFSWNSAAFTSNNGYIKKWVQGGLNLFDGNLFYDEAALPANFNDFFYRRSGSGASYTVFLYKNGVLINSFVGGASGNATIVNDIVNMPNLFINMSGAAPDFTINFSGYASIPFESCTQDAGSDNGYIREFDGACASWKKSSSAVTHTPRASNGTLIGIDHGSVSVEAAISRGTPATGSILNNNIVAAPASYFPIQLQIYTDLGSNIGTLDATDIFVKTNTENTLSDGPFYTQFFPDTAGIMIAVKTNAGCFDKILHIPNTIVLSVELLSFTGMQSKNFINLNWEMEANELVDRFELQKSTDGENFNTVAIVFTTEKKGKELYYYKEASPEEGNIIYRLRIFNKNGKVDYSNTLAFQNKENNNGALILLNNPVIDRLAFNFSSKSNGALIIRLIDMAGHIVQQGQITVYKGMTRIDLPLSAGLHSGSYVVDIADGSAHYSNKFIKR